MTRDHLITAIERHARLRGISPATLTGRAVGNSRLYSRLKSGGDCTTGIAQKLIEFIEVDGKTAPAGRSSNDAA